MASVLKSPNPTYISYRKPQENVSKFINIDDVLKSESIKKIYEVYKNVSLITSCYNPDQLDQVKAVETLLYDRIIELAKKKSQISLTSRSTILSLGIIPGVRYQRSKSAKKALYHSHQLFLEQLSLSETRVGSKKTKCIAPKVQKLMQLRLSDKQNELDRLKQNPRIARSLEKLEGKIQLFTSESIALGHSLEIRESIKKTHFVFNHGQGFQAFLVNLITKKLIQTFESTRYQDYDPLRHAVFIEDIQHKVSWYQEKLSESLTHDSYTCNDSYFKELICADCYLENIDIAESALFFFTKNSNFAFQNSDFLEETIETILLQYFPEERVRKKIIKKIKTIQPVNRGVLYSICIPKKIFYKVGYVSHAFGRPFNQDYSIEKINRLQEGYTPEEDKTVFSLAEDQFYSHIPQVRLLAHQLKPKKGVFIIPHIAIDPKSLEKIEDQIEIIIQRALLGFRV